MDALVEIDPNALYVFDRGYIDYRKFDEYCESEVRFTTRLKHNACIREVEEERPVDAMNSVQRDEIIWLGQRVGYHPRMLEVYKRIRQHWTAPFTVFVQNLWRKGERTSRGRIVYPTASIFAMTIQQYEYGDTDHLDDLVYDPLI